MKYSIAELLNSASIKNEYSLADYMAKVAENREKLILQCLQDLIDDGILVPKSLGISITRCADKDAYEINDAFKLELKDKEFIDKLKKENQELRDFIKDHIESNNSRK